MNVNDKINYLTDYYTVEKEDLMESLMIYFKTGFTEKMDINLYLSLQATLMNYTRMPPAFVFSFIKFISTRLDLDFGFENSVREVFDKIKGFTDAEDVVFYLSHLFGKYTITRTCILVIKIDEIEELAKNIA